MGQPFLHDLVTCVDAPTAVVSARDGQIRPGGVQGLLHADVRFLSELVVTIDGHEPVPIGVRLVDGGRCRFVAAATAVGDPIPDPTVRVERERVAGPTGMRESIAVVNDSRRAIGIAVAARLGVDLATIGDIKVGHGWAGLPARTGDVVARWQAGPVATEVRAGAGEDTVVPIVLGGEDHVTITWQLVLAARSTTIVTLDVEAIDARPGRRFVPVARPGLGGAVEVASVAPLLPPLAQQSLADLGALLLGDPQRPGDRFFAAGSPWFLTLFGRDSIWAARFCLPLGVDLAAGTLRTLARRQAHDHDPFSGAEPGKILHEVRTGPLPIGDRSLPPLYYGTVDATPLWITLLHDAWCWGLPDADVIELLDTLEEALAWVLGHAADGRDGFLSYRDASGTGLANQGWKDSGDAIQDAGGVIAAPPITLCEVQGYAHRAALHAARLLERFDRPGADGARAYAATLADRFRARFWVDGAGGRYPALALDADGRPVDSLTSNIGHLLGTGLLHADEEALVARWLGDARLASDFGLRTLDAAHPYYNPVGYHSGSVWPHDTAIAIEGLAGAGHAPVAMTLAAGLLAAAPHFEYRLPELFGGRGITDGGPLAYPAACRPQAWSAAAVLALLRAALGLAVDVPEGSLIVHPDPAFAPLFPLAVRGLRVMGHRLDVEVDAAGGATVATDAPLTVRTG